VEALTETPVAAAPAGEATRARYPDQEGYVERDGNRLFYEVYGEGEETLFLLPTWTLIHSRFWKAQIPYFARHMRVLTFDGLGNGRSDRPRDPRAYDSGSFALDALAVMDATGTERAHLACLSRGAQWGLRLGAEHGERVESIVFIGAFAPLSLRSQLVWRPARIGLRSRVVGKTLSHLSPVGGMHPTRIAADYRGFLEWWMRKCLPEAHSTRQLESLIEWGLDTDAATVVTTLAGEVIMDRPSLHALCDRIECPVLVINGDRDTITPTRDAERLARRTRGELLRLPRSGHSVGRWPVEINLAMRDFIAGGRRPRDPTVHRSDGRPRALYVSSPIGLGHARRDVAIAQELRKIVPDLEVDWLAQHPVTTVLEAEGERIHPASRHLANECAHIESESAEHDLHCFHAYRRMDELFVANYMLFNDVAESERHDLWICDEGWEVDHFLHENPNLKRAPFVWMTDFTGFLPMEDGGPDEAFLTADYNAERIEHVEGLPEIRDRSIYVGNPEDIVDARFGPDLPEIRGWTERHFDFSGYVTGFEPVRDREALRHELGYAADERVCIVTVGGSGVGAHLLRRVIDAYPIARAAIPDLRMIVVCGPRIDPETLPHADGLELRAYVHDLYKHLAACDLAIVQGGLTTAMELTANRRPFLYFPLKHHFEQSFHVHHRLRRYGAGRRMDFDDAPPEAIAAAISEEVGRDVDYLPVETDGARRAAERIAELL
jgi:pimeloyl-ACP methyl ester carboxylesterase